MATKRVPVKSIDVLLGNVQELVSKRFGEHVLRRASAVDPCLHYIPTGIAALDCALVGGFRVGRASLIWGHKSCLARNTLVPYAVRTSKGVLVGAGDVSIGGLRAVFLDARANGMVPCALSVDGKGGVFYNEIKGAIPTGVRECFRLTTVEGRSVEASADHRFFVDGEYVCLKDLRIGDRVQICSESKPPTTEDVVESVEPVGLFETFDLEMAEPHHNYVAAGFVTHNSCKSTIMCRAVAQAQRLCAECWKPLDRGCSCKTPRDPAIAYLDVEGAVDFAWAARQGVDLDRMLYQRPEYAEECLDVAEALILKGCDILVIDSIAFMTPSAEIKESTVKDLMGSQPRTIAKGIRKFVSAVNTKANEKNGVGPTLLFVNQVRHKMTMFGSPELAPGGFAPGFYYSTEVKVSPAKYHVDEKVGRPIYGDFNFVVDKNKAGGTPKMEGSFRMSVVTSEDRQIGDMYNDEALLDIGTREGMVSGGGKAWKALGEEFGSKAAIGERLHADGEFRDKMLSAVLAVLRSSR